MPADAQLEITDLVSRFVAKSDLERELAADADLLRGLAWGRGRFGHPEGRVGLQLASIVARIGGYPRMREERARPGRRIKSEELTGATT